MGMFAPWVGDLRGMLADKQRVLHALTEAANASPFPHYSDTMVTIAERIVRVERLAQMLVQLVPREAAVLALAEGEPFLPLIRYQEPGLNDQLLEPGRGLLIEARNEVDMGPRVRIDIEGDLMCTRYATVRRERIRGLAISA